MTRCIGIAAGDEDQGDEPNNRIPFAHTMSPTTIPRGAFGSALLLAVIALAAVHVESTRLGHRHVVDGVAQYHQHGHVGAHQHPANTPGESEQSPADNSGAYLAANWLLLADLDAPTALDDPRPITVHAVATPHAVATRDRRHRSAAPRGPPRT